jgi:hypothetical protein
VGHEVIVLTRTGASAPLIRSLGGRAVVGDLLDRTTVAAVVRATRPEAIGGGRVRAALLPIHGRERVVAFVAGLVRRFGSSRGQVVAVNGHPALRTSLAGEQQLVAVDIQAGRITAIYAILNPDKLHFIEAFASGQRGPGAAR